MGGGVWKGGKLQKNKQTDRHRTDRQTNFIGPDGEPSLASGRLLP